MVAGWQGSKQFLSSLGVFQKKNTAIKKNMELLKLWRVFFVGWFEDNLWVTMCLRFPPCFPLKRQHPFDIERNFYWDDFLQSGSFSSSMTWGRFMVIGTELLTLELPQKLGKTRWSIVAMKGVFCYLPGKAALFQGKGIVDLMLFKHGVLDLARSNNSSLGRSQRTMVPPRPWILIAMHSI